MEDKFQRNIDYIRISVTDRCNLRCNYCMPKDGIKKMSHDDFLTFEEIIRICKSMANLGISKVKITGGEPLVRKDVILLIKSIKEIEGIDHITLTTNGVLIDEFLEDIILSGVKRVNVSLDTLNSKTYEEITGFNEFHRVWNNINKLIKSGIQTKINCVPQKDVNENELMDMVKLVEKMPIHVRFIEMMPIGFGKGQKAITGEEIKSQILNTYPDTKMENKSRGFGPAEYLTSEKWKGNVGFITAMSNKFCPSCNRVRLTSNGYLKTCLCFDNGMDLMTLMRKGISDDELTKTIYKIIKDKPLEHNFGDIKGEHMEQKEMYKIGG